MSMTHQARRRFFRIIAVLALTLLAPVAVTAEDEVAGLALVAAPAAVGTSVDEVRATRTLAAQNALQSGDIGSMQEDRLLAIVGASPSWDETSGYGAVEASRAANAMSAIPDASTTAWSSSLIVEPDCTVYVEPRTGPR